MKKNIMKKISLIGLLILLCSLKQFGQTVYTVTLTTDPASGPGLPGQLRWAIEQANATVGESYINFNIPGTGPFTFSPTRNYPPISGKTVCIDGRTQPGYNYNDPGTPMIIIDGTSVPLTNTGECFRIIGCTRAKVFGLYIKKFYGGAFVQYGSYNEVSYNVMTNMSANNIFLSESNFNVVKGNYVNVDKTLISTSSSFNGIYVYGSNDNTIGGIRCNEGNIVVNTTASGIDFGNGEAPTGKRNLISGNRVFGTNVGQANPLLRNEIDLRTIGNAGKVAPVITSTGCVISGTSQANDNIEVFGSSGPGTSKTNAKVYLASTKADATTGAWSVPIVNNAYPFVIATATDASNNTSNFSVVSAVTPDPLTTTITNPSAICAKEKVTFGFVVKCTAGLQFSWDFGDGTPLSATATHTYITPGTYTVKALIYIKNACDPIPVQKTITVSSCPEYDCSPCSFTLGGTGLSLYYGSSFNPEGLVATVTVTGGYQPYTYSWTAHSNNVIFQTATSLSTIRLSYPGSSAANATVKVTDASGCSTYKTFYYSGGSGAE
jgi:hypothetical protein